MRLLKRPETFERDDLGLRQRTDRHDAGAQRGAIDKDRAGAALTKPAAEFGCVEPEIVAQHVEQGRVQIGGHAVHRAVHLQTDNHDRKALLEAVNASRGLARRRGPTGNETISRPP